MERKSIFLTVHDLGSGKQASFIWTAIRAYGYQQWRTKRPIHFSAGASISSL